MTNEFKPIPLQHDPTTHEITDPRLPTLRALRNEWRARPYTTPRLIELEQQLRTETEALRAQINDAH